MLVNSLVNLTYLVSLEYSPEHNGFIEVGLGWADVFKKHEVIR